MAGRGSLVVRLYTARRALPIIGATVTVSKKVDEDSELIAFRTTDQNGITESIEIETPDIEESQSPEGQPAGGAELSESRSGNRETGSGEENEAEGNTFNERSWQPFTVVDIQIDHPQYYSILIKNAQIFPEQESIQSLQLIPLPEFMNGSDNIIISVTPQDL